MNSVSHRTQHRDAALELTAHLGRRPSSAEFTAERRRVAAVRREEQRMGRIVEYADRATLGQMRGRRRRRRPTRITV